MFRDAILQELYPYNLLLSTKGTTDLELPQKWTADIQAGFDYALSTLPDEEWELVQVHYAQGNSLPETAVILSLSPEQAVERKKKALQKLRLPCRWNYIRYGISGYLKHTSEVQYRKGFRAGFAEGRKVSQIPPAQQDALLDQPIGCLELSTRAYNCLIRAGCCQLRDVAAMSRFQIQATRNLGAKGATEIARAMLAQGIRDTAWEDFLV